MELLLVVFLFILGLCVGSFINCLVYRLQEELFVNPSTSQESRPRQFPNPSGLGFSTRRVFPWRGLLSGRSYCDHCKKALAWLDNIPLLSFVLLRGRSRCCHKKISWQYPIVELVTGIITILIISLSNYELRLPAGKAGVTSYGLIIAYCLIIIFVSDLNYQVIPDQVIYPAIGVALVYRLFSFLLFTSQGLLQTHQPRRIAFANLRGFFVGLPSEVSFWGYLLTGLGAMGFFLLLHLVTKGKGMGLGDVKLAVLMGLLLGWPKIIIALYFAFLTGALAGVILILTGKKKFGQHIPFGPFLVTGTFVSWFWGERILGYLGHLGYLGGI